MEDVYALDNLVTYRLLSNALECPCKTRLLWLLSEFGARHWMSVKDARFTEQAALLGAQRCPMLLPIPRPDVANAPYPETG